MLKPTAEEGITQKPILEGDADISTAIFGSFLRPEQVLRTLGLKQGDYVADLGCGVGYFIVPAGKMVGATGRAVAVDIQERMLVEVRNRARMSGVNNVATVRADLEVPRATGLPNLWADWVLVANILHQAKPEPVLAEAHRIVKPEGKVVVVEWVVQTTPFGPPPERRLSPERVREIAEKVGLAEEKMFLPSRTHYVIIFRRKEEKGLDAAEVEERKREAKIGEAD
jgi:ubiquinone/menaquinone biosynthesis C-methylase UbiE